MEYLVLVLMMWVDGVAYEHKVIVPAHECNKLANEAVLHNPKVVAYCTSEPILDARKQRFM